jgi:hypothetical protein
LGVPERREVVALLSPLILGDAAARPERDPVGPVVDLDRVHHVRGEIGVEPAPELEPHEVHVERRVDGRARDVRIWMEVRRRVPADHNTGDTVVRTGCVVHRRIRVADLVAARFRRRADFPLAPERPAGRVVRERFEEEKRARGGRLRRRGGAMTAGRKKRADRHSSQEQKKRGTPHVHRTTVLRLSSAIVNTGDQREERVTPIELFCDLDFVFAITQVTSVRGEGV